MQFNRYLGAWSWPRCKTKEYICGLYVGVGPYISPTPFGSKDLEFYCFPGSAGQSHKGFFWQLPSSHDGTAPRVRVVKDDIFILFLLLYCLSRVPYISYLQVFPSYYSRCVSIYIDTTVNIPTDLLLFEIINNIFEQSLLHILI